MILQKIFACEDFNFENNNETFDWLQKLKAKAKIKKFHKQ